MKGFWWVCEACFLSWKIENFCWVEKPVVKNNFEPRSNQVHCVASPTFCDSLSGKVLVVQRCYWHISVRVKGKICKNITFTFGVNKKMTINKKFWGVLCIILTQKPLNLRLVTFSLFIFSIKKIVVEEKKDTDKLQWSLNGKNSKKECEERLGKEVCKWFKWPKRFEIWEFKAGNLLICLGAFQKFKDLKSILGCCS